MKELGIKAQYVKSYVITTKNSDFSTKLVNILDEQFNPSMPNAVWCTDITYIWTDAGFMYLTSIMDLFSCKIIAWTLSIIKREWINRFKIHDYNHAYTLLFGYIEAFYNTVRIHSHCNYMSPDQFEKLYEKKEKLNLTLAS